MTQSPNRVQPIRSVKGTRDLLPRDTALWQRVEDEARRVLAAYHFGEIRTPILEQTALFARSVGEDTDIVGKEMYTWEDHDLQFLARVRDQLLRETEEFVFSDDANFGAYREGIGLFVGNLEDAMRRGQAPKTPDNEYGLKGLVSIPDEMQRYREKGERESFSLTMFSARQLLQDVRLGDSLTLRPEATASVVRAYIEHSLYNEGGVHKLYYIGPMFRRDRPQKGRYRQFYQIGAEVLGSEHPGVDVEVFEVLTLFLKRLGLRDFTLLLNSVGDKNCRPAYVEVLRTALAGVKDQMCGDCQRRADTNPLRVLDCKVPADQPIIQELPKIIDHLCADCRQHFDQVRAGLDQRGIAYQLAPRLVRGLDYYTRTTYEITSDALGAQNSILGGGRYDGLSEMLGGPPAPGTGFAIGEDRLVLAVEAAGALTPERSLAVYVAWLGDAAAEPAAKLARELRERGLSVEMEYPRWPNLVQVTVREDGEVNSQIGYDREPRKKALGDPISLLSPRAKPLIERELAKPDNPMVVPSMAKGSDTNYLRLVPGENWVWFVDSEGLRERALEVRPEFPKLSRLLANASRVGARFAVIIGESELASGLYQVKDLDMGQQEAVEFGRLADYLVSRWATTLATK